MKPLKKPSDIPAEAWCAYGLEKDEWKNAGNRYTPEELRRMEESFPDLELSPVPPEQIHAE